MMSRHGFDASRQMSFHFAYKHESYEDKLNNDEFTNITTYK